MKHCGPVSRQGPGGWYGQADVDSWHVTCANSLVAHPNSLGTLHHALLTSSSSPNQTFSPSFTRSEQVIRSVCLFKSKRWKWVIINWLSVCVCMFADADVLQTQYVTMFFRYVFMSRASSLRVFNFAFSPWTPFITHKTTLTHSCMRVIELC